MQTLCLVLLKQTDTQTKIPNNPDITKNSSLADSRIVNAARFSQTSA